MSTQEQRISQIHQAADRPRAGIMDQALCVKVSFRRPGSIRKVGSQAQVAVEGESGQGALIDSVPAGDEHTEAVPLINPRVTTDLETLSVSKRIMQCQELTDIRQLDSRVKKYLQTKVLPSIFANGVFLVPCDSVPEVDHVLVNFQTSRATLVDTFMAAFERVKADDRERLVDLYDDRNYPGADKLRAAFSMDFEYISYGVSEKLRAISSVLFAREKEKMSQKFEEAGEMILDARRKVMADLTNHLVDRLLGVDDGGKRKSFKKTTLTNMREFLDNFNALNIVGDSELESLVAQAKQLLEGVDPEGLRTNEGLRDAIGRGFEQVKQNLDSMLESKPQRKMRLDVTEETPAETAAV